MILLWCPIFDIYYNEVVHSVKSVDRSKTQNIYNALRLIFKFHMKNTSTPYMSEEGPTSNGISVV